MQPSPDAAALLSTIAELLDDELLAAVPGPLQHKTRVAANLCRILEREWTTGEAAAASERARLAELLDRPDLDAAALRAELCTRVRDGRPEATSVDVWEVLVACCRDDLAIVKPGHDDWEGR